MIKLEKIRDNFVILIICCFIFLWDFKQASSIGIDSRIIILLISVFLIIEIIKDILNKKFNFIIFSISISIFITAHEFLITRDIDLRFIMSLFFVNYLFGVAYYYHDLILKNKEKIINIFLFIFFSSIVLVFFLDLGSNPEPSSCGALKNYLNKFDKNQFFVKFFHLISSYNLLFDENSHLGMIAVPIFLYVIYLITTKDTGYFSKFEYFVLISFMIITYLKSSATLLVGMTISSLAIILFNYGSLNKKFLYSILGLIVFYLSVFFTDEICKEKIIPEYKGKNVLQEFRLPPDSSLLLVFNSNKSIKDNDIKNVEKVIVAEELIKNSETKKSINNESLGKKVIDNESLGKKVIDDEVINEKTVKLKKALKATDGSLTSIVFFHAMKVTIYSFFEKPLGWGFQNYELAFKNFNTKFPPTVDNRLATFNSKDATSNFFKIITEFGIFGFLFYFFIFITLLSKKISIDNKIFLLPFVITQTIRGAGYFNGGFLLIVFIIIMIFFSKYQAIEQNK